MTEFFALYFIIIFFWGGQWVLLNGKEKCSHAQVKRKLIKSC